MNKREFLDIVFALVPNEANAIMDAFDEYVESNEPHWIPVTIEPQEDGDYLATLVDIVSYDSVQGWGFYPDDGDEFLPIANVIAWQPLPEPFKGVTNGRD